MYYLSDPYNVEVYLRKANRTLSDEASNELLLLYGRADTALEIALVEHSEFTVISGYCNKILYVSEVSGQRIGRRIVMRDPCCTFPRFAWRDP